MNFSDITKLKLVAPIYEGLAKFFSFGESVTETELHDKLSSMEPLTAQLEKARTEAVAQNGQKLTDLETRFNDLETKFKETESQLKVKDDRIAEMQVENSSQLTAFEDFKTKYEADKKQWNTERNVLAGQISGLKAGKPLEQDQGGEDHEITNVKEIVDSRTIPNINKEMEALFN